jgi:hypothetical protein
MMSALMILQKGRSLFSSFPSTATRTATDAPVTDHPVFGSEDAEVKAAGGMPVLGARLLRVSNVGDAILYSVYHSTYSV